MGNYTENGGNRISDNTTVMSVFQSGLPHAANYRHTSTRFLCCCVLIKKKLKKYIYMHKDPDAQQQDTFAACDSVSGSCGFSTPLSLNDSVI